MTAQWHIHLREREVVIGRPVDRMVLGRPLSHPYLALVDDRGDTLSEIHGRPYDEASRRFAAENPGMRNRRCLSRMFEYSAILTTPLGMDMAIRRAIENSRWKESRPLLRACIRQKNTPAVEIVASQPILRNAASGIQDIWLALAGAAREIDAMDLSYNRYGWGTERYNCQAMIATILHRTHIAAAPSGKLASPGWKILP